MKNEKARGKFYWYELVTDDIASAIAFYKSVVGWDTQAFDDSEDAYQMFTTATGPIGGSMVRTDEMKAMGAPTHWMAHVTVPDVDATCETIKTLGGKILVGPMDVPGIGRFATFMDPQGAALSAFSPDEEVDPVVTRSGPGEFGWSELATTDYEAAFKFYSELFGWVASESMDMGGGNTYMMYKKPDMEGHSLGGFYNKTPEQPVPAWLHYATVKNLDQALGAVKAGGGQVLNGPMDVPGGDRVAQCMDPQGAAFALHESAKS